MSAKNAHGRIAVIARSRASRGGVALALAAVLATSGCAAGRHSQTSNQVPTQDGTNANVGDIALRGIAIAAPPSGEDSYAPGSAVRLQIVLVNNGTHPEQLSNVVTSAARGWAAFRTESQAEQVIAAAGARDLPGSSGPSASGTPGTTPSATTPPSGTTTSPRTRNGRGSRTGSGSGSTSPSSTESATTSAVPTGATDVTIPPGQRVSFGVPDSQRVLLLRSSVGTIQPGTTVKITFTFSRSGSVTVPVPVQLSSDANYPTIPGGSDDAGD